MEPVSLPTRRDPDRPFDPPSELARLPAVVRLAFADGHVGWLTTSHAVARTVLSDPRFSVRPELRHRPLPFARPGGDGKAPAGFFPQMDRPEHTRYRRLLTGAFTLRRMKRLEGWIETVTAERLEAMAAAGPPIDLVREYALPIPSLVICELLGVPYRDHARFQELATKIVALDDNVTEAGAAMAELADYLGGLVLPARREPGDSILGALARDTDLTDEELANIGMVLLVAGHETTANMIALGAFALLRHPEQLKALHAEPAMIDTAVDELLRYLSILHVGAPNRAALADVELAGRRIAAGETVVLSLPAVNRDPERFEAPDELRLDRAEAHRHLAFGYGVHQCLGQQLARIELRAAYRGLFDRFPDLRLAVPVDDIRMRDNFVTYGVTSLPVTWKAPGNRSAPR